MIQIPKKPRKYCERVQWLVDNFELWKNKSCFAVTTIMKNHGIYSQKSNTKDTAYTVDNMIRYALEEIKRKNESPS